MTLGSISVKAQKNKGGVNSITSSELESYLSFLASPLLKGRMNGEEGLDTAAGYIAAKAKKIGLKPANGISFFQPYSVVEKGMDTEKTSIQITKDGKNSVIIKEPMFQFMPMEAADFELEGDVVFAGYGINAPKYRYNDLDSIETADKILLIMDRAPLTPDNKRCQFEDQQWLTMMGFQMKLQELMFTKAKAILIVTDPKSGFYSFEEAYPDLARYMKSSTALKGQKRQIFDFPGMPKIIFIHRSVADELLNGTGKNLTELQNTIDTELRPHSFSIKEKQIKITEASIDKDKILTNVAALIEGRDPVLKNEIVLYSAHIDHIGITKGEVNSGADDDGSGCVALLEMAEAFQSLSKKPLRSILFLWVSGEEIGLFGSQSYVNNPLFPLDKTVADINADMIGRVKSDADTSNQNPMTGPNSVFVIADNQSKELLTIADEAAKKTGLSFDYSLSSRTHPLQLFSRSDHFNFIQKDIPILAFTTGIPTDYHTPGDVISKINFKKMELITKTMYEIGYKVANKKPRIVVDSPYSKRKSLIMAPQK
jgi:hypothetical protein